jgi:ZIP family zinc transporter
MLEAAFWGFVGGASLLIGAVVGISRPFSARLIGLIMGFGAGVLISAVAFELTKEAFDRAGTDAVVFGLAAGALTFFVGDWIIDHRGGDNRKRSGGQQQSGGGAGTALALGALLDGVPESVAIGATLLGGGKIGIAVVAAVFLSNFPESLSSSVGMKKAGHSTRYILTLWAGVLLASTLAAAVGYVTLDGAPDEIIALIQGFAAGAILVMLSDTMVPEAVGEGGSVVGLVTTAGFVLAFLLSNA